MLGLGIAVLVLVLSAECLPASKEHGVLLDRLRRSPHYCGPEQFEPAWPAPQPPPPPPPPAPRPPPSSHEFPLPAPIFPPPFWRSHHHHHRYYNEPQRYQEQNIRNLENNSNKPCDTCDENKKPKNTAISNAQSETGSAVAIAISRSKKN